MIQLRKEPSLESCYRGRREKMSPACIKLAHHYAIQSIPGRAGDNMSSFSGNGLLYFIKMGVQMYKFKLIKQYD